VTPVAAAKKRSKFNLKTFLSTIDGGRTIVAAPTKSRQSLRRATRPIRFLTYREGR